MINICICTHNPRLSILSLVFESIAQQTLGKKNFDVLIVDNASTPPLANTILSTLHAAGINARLVFESVPGIARARLRAAAETSADWVLFVDDDNVLAPDYLAEGLAFIQQHPKVGCFGGKLLLAENLHPRRCVKDFLPYLGIKDIGEASLTGKSENWEQWEPPTAGAFVSRKILDAYTQHSNEQEEVFRLGRRGKNKLSSCEDSLIMRSAFNLDLENGYNPRLVLHHHLDPRRFRFSYLIRLMQGYGSSHVILEHLLRGRSAVPDYYLDVRKFLRLLMRVFFSESKKSYAFAIAMVVYHIGARREHMLRASPLNIMVSAK